MYSAPHVDILETIGQGAAGKIYKVMYNGSVSALKVLEKTQLTGKDLIEMDILTRSNHPNVLGAKKIYFPLGRLGEVCILMDLAEKDLFSYIYHQKSRKKMTISDVQINIFYKLLCAVSYLHANHITHRDIKPENILMMGNEPKIADFGLSSIYPSTDLPPEFVGTIIYMAPEMLVDMPSYTSAIDIWSLGVVFYYILAKDELIDAETREEAVQAIINTIGDLTSAQKERASFWIDNETPVSVPRRDYLSTVPAPWSDVIRSMLIIDPDKRPSAQELLNTYFPDRVSSNKFSSQDTPFNISLSKPYSLMRESSLRSLCHCVNMKDPLDTKAFFLGVDIADRFFTLYPDVPLAHIGDYLMGCFSIALGLYGSETQHNASIRCHIVRVLDFKLFRPTIDTRFPGSPVKKLVEALMKNPTPDVIE